MLLTHSYTTGEATWKTQAQPVTAASKEPGVCSYICLGYVCVCVYVLVCWCWVRQPSPHYPRFNPTLTHPPTYLQIRLHQLQRPCCPTPTIASRRRRLLRDAVEARVLAPVLRRERADGAPDVVACFCC